MKTLNYFLLFLCLGTISACSSDTPPAEKVNDLASQILGRWNISSAEREGKTTETFRNVLPIPSAEILANPNLSQNAGY